MKARVAAYRRALAAPWRQKAALRPSESGKMMMPTLLQSIAYRRIATLLAWLAVALGALVLVWWGIHLAVMRIAFPWILNMKVNTASGILFCGLALALLSRKKTAGQTRFWILALAGAAIALGALTLAENLFGWEPGVGRWLLRGASSSFALSEPWRMAPVSAFCFLLTGVALLTAAQPISARLKVSLLTAMGLNVIVVSGFVLTGNAAVALFGVHAWASTGMVVHTAFGFIVLGSGLLALGASQGTLQWSVDARTSGGFVVGMVALLTAAGMSYQFTHKLEISSNWVSHTEEVLKEIGDLLIGVVSLGSSETSYVNTGNEVFAERSKSIQDSVRTKIDSLRKLTIDRPVQTIRLNELAPLILQRIATGEQTIADRRQGDISTAAAVVVTSKGFERTGRIGQLISEMRDDEYSLLAKRREEQQRISDATFLILPLGAFVSITMLNLGLCFLNIGMSDRAQSEERSAWLASFPENNPDPIVEVDLATETVHYLNPIAQRLLPDLKTRGLRHPFLAGLAEVNAGLVGRPGASARREIGVGALFYEQTMNYIAETKRMRVYGSDITERKRVEDAVARLASIVEFSDDAIVGQDLHRLVTSWNKGAETTFGYTAAEMMGQSIEKLIPAGLQQREGDIPGRVEHGDIIPNFETMRLRKDGSTFPVSVTLSAIRDTSGHVVGAAKVVRDISARKDAEKARHMYEARYRTLFEYAPDGIAIVDLADRSTLPGDRHYMDVNATLCRMLGYTWDELTGIPLSKVVAERQVADIGAVLDIIASSDHHGEWEFLRKDETSFLADVVATRMPDGNLLAVIRDITGRKEAEKARLLYEARYRTLFEYAPDGIAIVDMRDHCTLPGDRHYMDVNATLCRMLGYTWDELTGIPLSKVVAERQVADIGPVLDNIASSDHHGEWQLLRKDGTSCPVDSVATMMPDGKLLAVMRDTTERNRARDEIHRLNADLELRVTERTAQLESANKELEAFSYSVSHDLRAPLRAVDGFSQAVLEDYGPDLPDECRKDMLTIRKGAQKMGELIDDLLTFSRLSRLDLTKHEVDTDTMVRGVLNEVGFSQQEERVEVRIGDLPPCQADAALLKQVWINLLSNALKYTGKREKALVEIGCIQEQGHKAYFVRDNGTGFNMKYAHKLFGVFQRLHRAEDYEGTGVGLAIVQRIVRRHGGRVWADAEEGRGATFFFTLEGEIQL